MFISIGAANADSSYTDFAREIAGAFRVQFVDEQDIESQERVPIRDGVPKLASKSSSSRLKTLNPNSVDVNANRKDKDLQIEWSQKFSRTKAWELFKEIYPEDSGSTGGQGEFFKDPKCAGSPKKTKEPKRTFIVDSGASFHLISRRDLTNNDKKSITTGELVTLTTANGIVQTDKIAKVWVNQLKQWITCHLLPEVPPLLSLGKLV